MTGIDFSFGQFTKDYIMINIFHVKIMTFLISVFLYLKYDQNTNLVEAGIVIEKKCKNFHLILRSFQNFGTPTPTELD